MTPVLEARGLTKTFGAVTAADDIHVAVADGEIVGIIGANGAGKTTFVNMVTGYLKPSAGQILYRGTDITGRDSREITKLGIHRSFQIAQVFPDITVLDNVLVALGVAGDLPRTIFKPLRSPKTEAAADEIIARYGIGEYRNVKAGLLPQGVRKLLDIAMAMVGDPKIILLDEPTSGVSADEKLEAMRGLLKVLKDDKVTVLFVEHDMEIVGEFAQRVIAFYDGRILADGKPDEVLSDSSVREFVIGPELHRRSAGKD
ncbi:MAG: ABC transporter ATP-binding protein [Rhodospirillaceae bacterium]|nr:ABC transporter ATP-binding protein [Rhodospirillaceae bacterium]